MSELVRMRVALNWPAGGPGVNTYYFSMGTPPVTPDQAAEQIQDELGAIFAGFNTSFVTGLTWAVEPAYDVVDVPTGNIVGQGALPGTMPSGAGTNAINTTSRAQQIRLTFRTDKFYDGRRLRGGTFIGPVGGGTLNSNGEVPPGTGAGWADKFSAVTTGLGVRLAVYSRPTPQHEGRYGDVVNVTSPPVLGTLRSRRD